MGGRHAVAGIRRNPLAGIKIIQYKQKMFNYSVPKKNKLKEKSKILIGINFNLTYLIVVIITNNNNNNNNN